jgi:hypothetical protein
MRQKLPSTEPSAAIFLPRLSGKSFRDRAILDCFLIGAFLVWNFIAAPLCSVRDLQPGGGTIGLSHWTLCAHCE